MINKEASQFIFIAIDKTHIRKFLVIDMISSTAAYFLCKYVTHKEWIAVCSSIIIPYSFKKLQMSFQKKSSS